MVYKREPAGDHVGVTYDSDRDCLSESSRQMPAVRSSGPDLLFGEWTSGVGNRVG
jgi:hypothetical protein